MIRYGAEKDYNLAREIWLENFTDSVDEVDFYFKNIYKKENFLILEEDSEIKGSLHENPYNISFNNNLLPSFYIVAVAVSPEYRGKGYMKKLLNFSLQNAFSKGLDMVFLSPINTEIYSSFGFGYISGLEHYKIKLEDISFNTISKDIEIKKVGENDFDSMIELYNRKMRANKIYLQRDKSYFSRIKAEIESDNGKIYVFYKEQRAVGYLMCYFKEGEISIREFFYSNVECGKTMLGFLKTFKEYYSDLEVTTPQGSNFNFLFPNQLKVEKSENPYILARILNVKNLFSYLNIKDISFKIKVNDSVISENNGVFSIDRDGNIEKVESEDKWNIEIDIRDLATLFSGYMSIDELLELEKIKVEDIDLGVLRGIFKKERNYIQEFQ